MGSVAADQAKIYGPQAKSDSLPLFSFSFFSVVKYILCKIHHFIHFKMYHSVAFGTFTILCNYHRYVVPECFITSRGNPTPIKQSIPTFPPPIAWQPLIDHLIFWGKKSKHVY